MKAALYARYSSDRQNERSIADQFAVLERHAEARGWQIVARFEDAAISGAAMANRPGLQTMMLAAGAGAFEAVLVEDEDRLARNLEHQAHIFNRLRHAGVAIATLATDRIGILEVGLKGVMSELYLVNLSQKTRRGMRSNAEKGLATGARTYGYRGEAGGRVTIVETEAAIIREIFDRYGKGETPRELAADLNRRGVPSPKASHWNASTIHGDPSRGNGILEAELYNGVKVFNRMLVVKDPDTGKRLPKLKPRADWRRVSVEHLRIVSPEAWAAARARKGEHVERPATVGARKATLFSGLLKCGCCGASYVSYSKTRLICASHRERGAVVCANARMPLRAPIEARVLEALQRRLCKPEAAAIYARKYREEWAAQAKAHAGERQPLEKRIAELRRREDRIVEAFTSGDAPRSMLAKAKDYETERLALEAELAALEARAGAAPAIELHPSAPANYAKLVGEIRAALAAAQADATAAGREALDAARRLVLRVDVTPDAAAEDGYRLDLVGDLALFLEAPAHARPPVGSRVVAGGGYGAAPNGKSIPVRVAA